MRIVVAAEDGWATEALCSILRELAPHADVEILPGFIASKGRGALPGLLLIDIEPAGQKAPRLVADLTRQHAGCQVVAMGRETSQRFVESLLEAGALAYLSANLSSTIIRGTLRLILHGKPGEIPGPAMNTPAEHRVADAEASPDFGLTKRQADVVALLCEGKSNQAIAQHLGIAVGTVKQHMMPIFEKLQVRNRQEAVLLASRARSVNFRQIKKAEGGKLDLDWLLGHMTHQRLSRDTVLFRLGDPAVELYYLQRGTIRLEEIGAELTDGTMFGEIGIFSPAHARTSSAICLSNVDLFRISADQVKRLYLLNPQFGLYVVHLISQRLMADRARKI